MIKIIEAYVGLPGAGKTYAMIERLRKTVDKPWNRKIKVYSNMPLRENYLRKLTKWQGELEYMKDWEDLVEAENGIILIDELNLWMPSRVWSKVPGPLLYKWAQVRKSGLEIWFTCQSASRVDKVVRELVFESYHLTSYKKLNLFVSNAHIGLGEKKTCKAFIRFRMSTAKIYDTHGYINVPDVYKEEMYKTKRDKARKKEDEKLQIEREHNEKLENHLKVDNKILECNFNNEDKNILEEPIKKVSCIKNKKVKKEKEFDINENDRFDALDFYTSYSISERKRRGG